MAMGFNPATYDIWDLTEVPTTELGLVTDVVE
jgi:hypothetical protein